MDVIRWRLCIFNCSYSIATPETLDSDAQILAVSIASWESQNTLNAGIWRWKLMLRVQVEGRESSVLRGAPT